MVLPSVLSMCYNPAPTCLFDFIKSLGWYTYWPPFLGPYGKLWNLVFPIRIHGPREATNRSGKKKICNLQYGSRTQLVKGIHVTGKAN